MCIYVYTYVYIMYMYTKSEVFSCLPSLRCISTVCHWELLTHSRRWLVVLIHLPGHLQWLYAAVVYSRCFSIMCQQCVYRFPLKQQFGGTNPYTLTFRLIHLRTSIQPRMLNPRDVAGAQASPGKQLVRVEIQSLGGAAFQAAWISPTWGADMGLTWSQVWCWRNGSPIKNPDRGVCVTPAGWLHVGCDEYSSLVHLLTLQQWRCLREPANTDTHTQRQKDDSLQSMYAQVPVKDGIESSKWLNLGW